MEEETIIESKNHFLFPVLKVENSIGRSKGLLQRKGLCSSPHLTEEPLDFWLWAGLSEVLPLSTELGPGSQWREVRKVMIALALWSD